MKRSRRDAVTPPPHRRRTAADAALRETPSHR